MSTPTQQEKFRHRKTITMYLHTWLTQMADPQDLLKFQKMMPSMNRQKIANVPSCSNDDFSLQHRQQITRLSNPPISTKHATIFIKFWPTSLKRQQILMATIKPTARVSWITLGILGAYIFLLMRLLRIIWISGLLKYRIFQFIPEQLSEMSGTGEKRELKQLVSNLHEMLRYLGESDGDKLVIKIDEFEYLRRDFIKAAEQYEKASTVLPNTSDRRERGVLLYQISNNRSIMDTSLRQMMAMCMKMNEKIKSAQHKNKEKDNQKGKLEDELQYKNLTVYQLQNTYFKLTKKEHKDVAKHKNQNYPEELTLEELKLRKPLKRGFSEETDPESMQYLKQKQILDAIKYIDARIEQKMDYILDGLRMLNYNAVTISESIGVVHKKIIINVENLDENLEHMEEAEKLLEEAAPLVSKPNCIMNVIIVALLAVLVYFIIKKVMNDSNQP